MGVCGRRVVTLLFCWVVIASTWNRTSSAADTWPQFRGLNATGRAATELPLPTDIAPDKHVLWKTPLPPGHSSPAISGDRIFVTGVREKKLVTIALDRKNGELLWEVEAPYEKLENIHGIGSYAQPTPATDGERVVALFGSSGLWCYDKNGAQLWHKPMGPFNNDFGAGSSPIIVDDWVILCQDHDTDSFLAAIDKRTGKTIWQTDRREFPRNYCTPVIWEVDGKRQIVIAATLRVVGYDFETGKEIWTVRGISRTVCMTPVVGDDQRLYVAGWAAGGDADAPIRVEPFEVVAPQTDANGNGTFEEDELPEGPIKQRFTQVDRNKNGSLDSTEYEFFRSLFEQGRNVVLAIRPRGVGDVTGTHVEWQATRFVPFCASPLYYRGMVFTVKDGGIFCSLEAATGKPLKQGRVPGTGSYYSSPVAGDGKIYLLNEEGKMTVVSAEGTWRVLATSDFADEGYATPAIVDGRIYVRTQKHLFCFGGRS